MPSVQGRAVQVPSPHAPFELIQKEFPEPGPGQVRIRIQACGICHSDSVTKDALFPGIAYPRVPGHEVAGIVDAIGPDVPVFKTGQRVGLGWHGGHCNYCEPCRRGDFMLCQNGQIAGISYDGGYADYVLAPANALAFIPDGLTPVEAGPLMCAGVTTFNSLRNSGARTGDTVAIVGIGGLGHLAIQFAAKAGYRTVAIGRGSGSDKAHLASQLGAHVYIDNQTQDPAAELQKLGGAKIILSTVTAAEAVESVAGGLKEAGKLIVLGVPERALSINAIPLILGERAIAGWPAGTGIDSEDTLNFSVLTGIRPQTEVFPLEKASEGYDRMMSGKARFRAVLTTGA